MANKRHSAFELLRLAQRAGAREVAMDGVLWFVYEMPASSLDRRASPSLIFESEETVRRVRVYPENWRELSDVDLFALSWAR